MKRSEGQKCKKKNFKLTIYTSSNCSIFRIIGPYLEPLSYISNNRFMNRVELWNKFGHEPSRPMTQFKPQVESNHNASWILQAGFLINLVLRLCYLNPCALVPFCLCLCVCISVRWAVMEKSRLASYIFNEIFKYKV